MPLPRTKEARDYYRAALNRLDDAVLLRKAGRTTGAVYLAGYTVECMLKALLLAGTSRRVRDELLRRFRGSIAHDLEWLAALYRRHVGGVIPVGVARHVTRVAGWSTDMRYVTGVLKSAEADSFMASVRAVSAWADGRM
jgi:hypothetical protein